MKKLLLLMVFAVGTVWSQTAPSAYTTYKNLRQYALGANPGADSLNAQWSEIDSFLVYPGYSYEDSVISTGNAIKIGSWDGTDAITIPGKITSLTSVTTEGTFGVPVVVDVVSATGQTVSITATNISSSTATGIYRISAYLEHDVVDVSSDSVYAKITWKGNSGESVSDSTAYCFLTALGNNANDTFFIYHAGAGATSITYEAVITDNGDDAYTLKLVAERLN